MVIISDTIYFFNGSSLFVVFSCICVFKCSNNDSAFSITAWVYMEDCSHFKIANKLQTSNQEWIFHIDSNDKLYLTLYDNSTGKIRGRYDNTTLTSREGDAASETAPSLVIPTKPLQPSVGGKSTDSGRSTEPPATQTGKELIYVQSLHR